MTTPLATPGLDTVDFVLLDQWQRDFPLEPRPFARIGSVLDLTEEQAIARLRRLRDRGMISRLGAVVRPNTAGASTLAAMAVPAGQLEEVAKRVNADPLVNHNYEREHELNLWYVVTAPDRTAVSDALARIAVDTGLEVLDLPLEQAYHIDLGFRLSGPETSKRLDVKSVSRRPNADDRKLLASMEDGLQLVTRPYLALSERLSDSEEGIICRLRRLIESGVISRFGLVIRHRQLGFRANGMAVWDLPDERVDDIAARFASFPFVTLCYRRPRRRPTWPYNLFCMVHGRDRAIVRGQLAELNAAAGTQNLPQAVLFSRRCFKQRGARFSDATKGAAA